MATEISSHNGELTAEVPLPPPFDPELAAALEVLGPLLPPGGLTAETILQRRRGLPGVLPPSDEDLARAGRCTVREILIPGPAGGPDLGLLVCLPEGRTTPAPAIYHIHGGGMVSGSNRQGLMEILGYAADLGAAVLSVEYRLAPESPHPAPVQDCYAGLTWTADHAAELGIDAGQIVAAGASAGGGLTAGVALLARDRAGPSLAGFMALIPMLDDRNDTPSAVQMSGRGIWDRASNETGWTALLGAARGTPDVSPYAAPARTTDLAGLPPAFIDVGSAETFRDEAVAFASRIWQAGGRAELHVWPGGFHGFDTLVPGARLSREARAARFNWLRRLLAD